MVIVIKNVKKGKKKISKERLVVLEQLFYELKNIPLLFLQHTNEGGIITSQPLRRNQRRFCKRMAAANQQQQTKTTNSLLIPQQNRKLSYNQTNSSDSLQVKSWIGKGEEIGRGGMLREGRGLKAFIKFIYPF
ncbi:unnamed protein product [Meloidogyne enterolobii]|uniref:Uncharacterized protein n=1 Tax=Meloidogyne enterolobii TaxID=390850 RepID=A0ACB0YRV5_MELEN